MNIFFVFNPKSGKGQLKNKLGDIIELFSNLGHDITIKATTKRGDATDWVRDLPDGYDRVVCAGGDGTLDEVVWGMSLRENKLPIGYIPAGSTNDFARSLGLPVDSLEAARVAISSNIFDCDLGEFNGRKFVYVAAFGLFTDVSYDTPQELKNKFGHAAYVMEGLKKLGEIKPIHIKADIDGEIIEDDVIVGMITNSVSVGGFKNVTGKHIDLNDGLFEVNLFKNPESPHEMNEIINAILIRDLNCSMIYNLKGRKIKITCDEEIPWTLDGEFGGNEKEAIILNKNKDFQIVVE